MSYFLSVYCPISCLISSPIFLSDSMSDFLSDFLPYFLTDFLSVFLADFVRCLVRFLVEFCPICCPISSSIWCPIFFRSFTRFHVRFLIELFVRFLVRISRSFVRFLVRFHIRLDVRLFVQSFVRFHVQCLVPFLDRDVRFDFSCPIWDPFQLTDFMTDLLCDFLSDFIVIWCPIHCPIFCPISYPILCFLNKFRKIYLTFLWNDLTIDWNDLTWNNLTMERNDRKSRFLVRSFVRKNTVRTKNGDFGTISSREGSLAIFCNHSLLRAITQAHFHPNFVKPGLIVSEVGTPLTPIPEIPFSANPELGLKILYLPPPPSRGRGEVYSVFQVTGMIKRFLGVWNFLFRDFFAWENFGEYLFW